jgi:hypothetical protein
MGQNSRATWSRADIGMKLNYEGLISIGGGILAWAIASGWIRHPNEIVRRQQAGLLRFAGTVIIIWGVVQLFDLLHRI